MAMASTVVTLIIAISTAFVVTENQRWIPALTAKYMSNHYRFSELASFQYYSNTIILDPKEVEVRRRWFIEHLTD
ncbi:hypothetical protein CHUAL_002128 [Chamberlinius hualienensis]